MAPRQGDNALPAWGLAGASRSAEWRLAKTRTGFTLSTPEREESFDGRDAARLSVSRWWFGRSLVVGGAPTRRYRGVTPADAVAIRIAIHHQLARSEHAALLERACAFQASFSMMLAYHLVERRWIPHDRVAAILASRPSLTELHLLLKVPLEDIVTAQERDALALLGTDLLQTISVANARILRKEFLLQRDPALGTYDLVLVDEFQDTSRSRARLVRALCAGPDKYLLAVGDDWQAINRFAGADLSAMTDFERLFGPGPTLMLQTTFRNTQRIADVASRFVSRNPSQLHKNVVAANEHLAAAPVTIVRVASRQALAAAIQTKIHDIATVSPGCTVDVLGRYQHERQLMPHQASAGITLTFRTVHASKGLEADHVILPNLTTGTFGFPSQIADDPVLNLAMSDGDGFPHSEERRLFYVALTRARQSVTIFTVAGLESPFVVELLTDPDVVILDSQGATTHARSCPGCGLGTLVLRSGRYGEFYGCSTFPKCSHTVRLERIRSGT